MRRRPVPFYQTVRARLLLIALLPMLILLPLFLWGTVNSWSNRFDDVLTAKVNSELTIAQQHLAGLMEARSAAVAALGQSAALTELAPDAEARQAFLGAQTSTLGLDFLTFLPSGAPSSWPVVAQARDGAAAVAIDLFDHATLNAMSPRLAARAAVPLIDTPAATPTERSTETRGMVIHIAAPAPGGVLVGGVLLNRNLGFIDAINDLVYPEASLTKGSAGTATLFLEDVRVSTNVRMFGGERALGTRVSAAVRNAVLTEGRTWLARAFVVNDWYVSAYEPIIDSFGNRIGMLYVGFLEAPFADARVRTYWQIGLAFLALLALSVPVLLRWAQGIFGPLERMHATISRVEAGKLAARTGKLARRDEIARVAAHLDDLLDRLAAREGALRELNEELEERVHRRTEALEDANQQLRDASARLVLNEKLATIGEITAGVAHEINNPLAVIQGNLDVIHADLGAQAAPLETEFRLIFEQVHMIHVMVSKLLQLSRPDEYSAQGSAEIDDTIRATLPLVQHRLENTEVILTLDAAVPATIGTTALQQVLVNIISNACDAMAGTGRLTISSHCDAANATITLSDTGTGMDDETLRRLFEPFFTGRPGEGTGLGLALSRRIIDGAGGEIRVTSTPGTGSTFIITLPLA